MKLNRKTKKDVDVMYTSINASNYPAWKGECSSVGDLLNHDRVHFFISREWLIVHVRGTTEITFQRDGVERLPA